MYCLHAVLDIQDIFLGDHDWRKRHERKATDQLTLLQYIADCSVQSIDRKMVWGDPRKLIFFVHHHGCTTRFQKGCTAFERTNARCCVQWSQSARIAQGWLWHVCVPKPLWLCVCAGLCVVVVAHLFSCWWVHAAPFNGMPASILAFCCDGNWGAGRCALLVGGRSWCVLSSCGAIWFGARRLGGSASVVGCLVVLVACGIRCCGVVLVGFF